MYESHSKVTRETWREPLCSSVVKSRLKVDSSGFWLYTCFAVVLASSRHVKSAASIALQWPYPFSQSLQLHVSGNCDPVRVTRRTEADVRALLQPASAASGGGMFDILLGAVQIDGRQHLIGP